MHLNTLIKSLLTFLQLGFAVSQHALCDMNKVQIATQSQAHIQFFKKK